MVMVPVASDLSLETDAHELFSYYSFEHLMTGLW